MNEYKPNTNEMMSFNETMSNDYMTYLLQLLQERKAQKTLDNLYFAKICIELAKEAIEEIEEESNNEQNKKLSHDDKQTNKWENIPNDEIKPLEIIKKDPFKDFVKHRNRIKIFESDIKRRGPIYI